MEGATASICDGCIRLCLTYLKNPIEDGIDAVSRKTSTTTAETPSSGKDNVEVGRLSSSSRPAARASVRSFQAITLEVFDLRTGALVPERGPQIGVGDGHPVAGEKPPAV
jgi:hypothetical protein